MQWILLFITVNPDVQEQIHAELDEVIGSDRMITLDDKNNLHYLNATIAEAQRYANIGAFNLFHRTTRDVKIHGHAIPQNTHITYAIQSIHKDERYFDEPKRFNPSRFLDRNGKYTPKAENIPFGVGKRACLGEGLARVELFLFTANLLNQLKLAQVPNKPISMRRIVGGTVTPEPYVLDVETRWSSRALA